MSGQKSPQDNKTINWIEVISLIKDSKYTLTKDGDHNNSFAKQGGGHHKTKMKQLRSMLLIFTSNQLVNSKIEDFLMVKQLIKSLIHKK